MVHGRLSSRTSAKDQHDEPPDLRDQLLHFKMRSQILSSTTITTDKLYNKSIENWQKISNETTSDELIFS